MSLRRHVRQTRLIGITGGIASGKSTLLDLARASGAAVIDSDRIVHQLLRRGTRVFSDIVAAFGEAYLDESGQIDRRKLGRTVFTNRAARKKLERIIHPAVFAEIAARTARYRISGRRIVAVDIPLLYEARAEKGFDEIAVAYVPRRVQLARLVKRGFSRRDALARIGAQWSLERKRRRADRVFDMTRPIRQIKQEVRTWLSHR